MILDLSQVHKHWWVFACNDQPPHYIQKLWIHLMMFITLSIQFHVECVPLPWIVTSSSSCLFVFVFMLNCTTEWSGVRWSELWNQHKNYHFACTTFDGIMRRICNNWIQNLHSIRIVSLSFWKKEIPENSAFGLHQLEFIWNFESVSITLNGH